MLKKLLSAIALSAISLNYVSAQCTVVATASGGGTTCENSNICFIGGATGGTGPYTFMWSGPNSWASSQQNPCITNVQLAFSGQYALIVTDINSCSDTAYVNVTVNPQPAPPVATNVTICQYITTTLTAQGQNLFWYTQQTGGVGVPSVSPNTTVPGVVTYWVSQTVNGCESQRAQQVVTVIPEPAAPVLSANSPVCQGDTLFLWANTNVGATYSWTGPNNFNANTQNPYLLNADQTMVGTYTAVVDVNGCQSQPGSIVVSVTIPPAITSVSFLNPATLSSYDGSISLFGLTNGTSYFVNYLKDGLAQTPLMSTASNNSVVISNLGQGIYSDITVSYLACPSNVIGPITLTAFIVASDSVWPGDVNYDLLADNNDVLDLALAYGQTGGVRTGASNTWTAQYSVDWGTMQTCNFDMKHADCNGDGTVDANDTTAISLNYGQTHLKGEHVPQAKSAAAPDLYFDFTGINFTAGTTVNIPIKLGTTTIPMNNIMGIAANLHVNGFTLTNPPVITANTSWMGNNSNLLNFSKAVSTSQADWTLARTDHSNVSGDGTIATLTVDIPTGVQGQDITLYFDDVKIIDNGGIVITNYNVIDDTATVLDVNAAAQNIQYASVVPNPSEGVAVLHVSLTNAASVEMNITDIAGRSIKHLQQKMSAGLNKINLPASELAAGVYTIQLKDQQGAVSQNLKWVRK